MKESSKRNFVTTLVVVAVLVLGILIYNFNYTSNKLNEGVYVFEPASNSGLNLKIKSNLSEDAKTFVLNRMADTQKTIASFDETTTSETKINTLFMLAADHQLLGDYDLAKKTLEDALALKVDPGILQMYASVLMNMGGNEIALKYINDAISINRSIPNFWRTKIDLERSLNPENPRALEPLYLEAIQATSEDVDMITFYAVYLEELGRKDESVSFWKKAIEKYPAKKELYQQEIDRLKSLSN